MSSNEKNQTTRRGFLSTVGSGAAALGLATLTSGLQKINANTGIIEDIPGDPEQVFKNLKGKHRVVFDVPEPTGIFPFAWPRVFLLTNMATGTAEKDINVVVVLRHSAIPYAFDHALWSKYNLAKFFNVPDASDRNPFWKPAKGTYKLPGFGEVPIGINELQDSGVQFVVCNAALTVYSAAYAEKNKLDAETVKKDWIAGLLPGVTIVPSGVWALGRAQENNCGYIFASSR
jgi:intracellular sulfur oxidation DsrE/DsrF family protein